MFEWSCSAIWSWKHCCCLTLSWSFYHCTHRFILVFDIYCSSVLFFGWKDKGRPRNDNGSKFWTEATGVGPSLALSEIGLWRNISCHGWLVSTFKEQMKLNSHIFFGLCCYMFYILILCIQHIVNYGLPRTSLIILYVELIETMYIITLVIIVSLFWHLPKSLVSVSFYMALVVQPNLWSLVS